jgi:DNA helicase-2/ATP-dependent DNA helicase PcrA
LEPDNNNKAVKLLTVHGAKGLEFDTVFISGLEDGLFPIVRDGDKEESEEERRLFYVALTRAKKTLFITHAMTRLIYGSRELNSPSEFIVDIENLLSPAEAELKTFYLD